MRRLLLLALATAVLACKSVPGGDPEEPAFSTDAQENLRKGNEAMESGDYATASRYFDYVKSKYPFLDEAKQADLRIGDAQLAAEAHIEGRERFLQFVKMHPTHADVDYAAFKAAESYWMEAPDEFFAFPPAFEKDLTLVKQAVNALQAFQRDYPTSNHKAEAQKVLDQARRRLAQHELYAAEFYEKRKQWPAVVNRLKTVAEQYGDLGYEADALFRLHAAYKAMNDSQAATDTLKQIITRLPGTPAAEKANKLLGS